MPNGVNDDNERNPLNDERNPGQAHYEDLAEPDDVRQDLAEREDEAVGPQGGNGSSNGGGGSNSGNDQSGKGQANTNDADTPSPGRLEKFLTKHQGGFEKLWNLRKSKWFIAGGIGGSGIFFLVILLIVMLAAYKVPDVTENIASWRFARVMMRQGVQNERTVGTKIAIDSADEGVYATMKATYNNGKGKVDEQWSKLDKYRPNKQIANLNKGGMVFNYKGRQLVGITINDKTLLTPKSTFLKRRIPFYSFNQGIEISRQFTPELDKALDANEVGPIVRGIVNTKLRKQLGIGWAAWKLGQYKGRTDEQVRIAEEKANAKAVETTDASEPHTQSLAEDSDKVAAAQDAVLESDDKVKAQIENGGVSPDVQEVVDGIGKEGAFKTALKFLTPVYGIAVPLCIVYDGSTSGSNTDANSQAAEKSWMRLQTVGDQIKDGNTVDASVARAYGDKLGDTNDTVVTQRFRGAKYANTDASPSPEANADGSFTLFDATFKGAPQSVINKANDTAGPLCSALTNTSLAIGIGIISQIPAFFTGGASDAALDVVGQATRHEVESLTEKSIVRFSVRRGLKTVGNNITGGQKLKIFFGKELAKGAALGGLTYLAKQYVVSHSGQLNNGLEQGADYTNQADCGADINANEISRRYQFGRPLTADEKNVDFVSTETQVASINASKSTFQRYLALSNPNSLMTGVGTSLASSLNRNALTKPLGTVLSPGKLGSMLVGTFSPTARADAAVGDTGCRDVQFGWSQQELSTIQKTPTYEMLENQSKLDASGKEDEIASKYGKCFGLDDTTLGTLLQNGDIQRDDDGNVIPDAGDCSPDSLGPNNPDYGDLVFRWRVAQADNADLDEKINEQTISDNTTIASTGAGADFNIATLNIAHSDGQAAATWQGRLHRSVTTLTKADVDIAGLQEVRPNQNVAFQQQQFGGSTYGIYPANNPSTGTGGLFTPNPVIWNKTKFQLAPDSEQVKGPLISYFDDTTQQTSQAATVVKLISLPDPTTGNPGGQEFFVANTHDPADTPKHGDNADLRLANAKRYVPYFQNLAQQTQLPIFFTGDFNNRFDIEPGNPQNNPVGNICTNLTYRIISAGGTLRDASDGLKDQDAPVCPKSAATPDNKNSIDHIFSTKDVTIDSFKDQGDAGPAQNGSDHHDTVVAHATIVAGAVGATATASATFTAGTYNISHELEHGNDNGANCELNACAVKRSQTQANIILGQDSTPQMDIVAGQEVSQPQHDRFKTMLTSYSYFPAEVPKDQGNAIYWNTAKFAATPLDSGYISTINNVAKPFQRPWVELQAINSTQTVYVMSIHAPNNLNNGNPAIRAKVAQDALDWAKSKTSATSTVIVMGDYNERPETKNTYCVMTNGAVMANARDRGTCPSVTPVCPDNGGTACPKGYASNKLGIDQIYYSTSGGASSSGWGMAPNAEPYKSASDHLPVYATITLPGGGTSTTTPTPSSSFVGNDGFAGGSCVAYVEYILNLHSSNYHGGTLGDGKDVAKSLGNSPYGYTVDHTPAVHAVVSFGKKYANHTFGHVALVAQINPDGSIVVEEANWANSYAYGTHTVSADEVPKLTYAHTEVGWH